jgi:hypothetical protein
MFEEGEENGDHHRRVELMTVIAPGKWRKFQQDPI